MNIIDLFNLLRPAIVSDSVRNGSQLQVQADISPYFTANQPSPAATAFRSLTTSNTGEIVKNSAGNLYSFSVQNLTGAAIYVKFYNKASAATGGDTPVAVFQVSANGSVYQEPNAIQRSFSTGISIRTTTGAADADVASPATSPIVELLYK